MALDADVCYRAVCSRDSRFDGRFYTAVRTTGIYCRPSCPARTPRREHVRFYRSAAAAEQAGFRACRRCRPEVSPDAPDWDIRADLVGRALRLIADGVVDRDGVRGLAARLAVGERHLHRLFVAELGASPLAVARTRRTQLARQLLDQTDLPVTGVAYAAGFASLRQFNDTIRRAYGRSPTSLRSGRAPAGAELTLRLGYRPPLAGEELLAFLADRATPGVEEVDGATYRRTLRIGGRAAQLALRIDPAADAAVLTLDAADPSDVARVVQRSRVLLDLDADPAAVAAVLRSDPLLSPLVATRPGLRLPGAFDGFETAVRIVLGQQVSVGAARTLAGRLAARAGEPLPAPSGSLTTLFPTPLQVRDANLDGLGITGARATALRTLAAAVAAGDLALDGSGDAAHVCRTMMRIPGIGSWTVALIAMRCLRDPDALPAGDLALRRALASRGLASTPAAVAARAQRWRPWRGYALLHLWCAEAAGRPSEGCREEVA